MKKNSSGQTLIEMAIALSAILLTLAAIAILITTSLSNSTFIRSQGLASKYAQEGMEYVRYLRNNDIAAFSSYSGSGSVYCLGNDNSLQIQPGGGTCQINVGNEFKRQVEFPSSVGNINCPGQTEVKVTVFWSSGKCTADNAYCHSSLLISCFDNPSTGGVGL